MYIYFVNNVGVSPSPPACGECLEKVPPDLLDQVCSEQILLRLTEHITEWYKLAIELGLRSKQWESIETNSRWQDDLGRQKLEMFRMWKNKKKKQATHR